MTLTWACSRNSHCSSCDARVKAGRSTLVGAGGRGLVGVGGHGLVGAGAGGRGLA